MLPLYQLHAETNQYVYLEYFEVRSMADGYGTSLPRNVRNEIRSKIHDGRTINHSVCDVIDNSIDADASTIEVWLDTQPDYEFMEEHEKGFLMFIDNGNGIKGDELKHIIEFNAERKGAYKPHELGSFGLGLKDALLAHGKEITVLSRRKGDDFSMVRLSMQLSYERDDWIYVDNNQLIELRKSWHEGHEHLAQWNTPVLNHAIQKIEEMEKGTIVLLEFTHRQLEIDIDTHDDDDLARISVTASLKEWIAMTFSDYLSGITIGNRTEENPLIISLNGEPILPLDPFMKSEIGVGPFEGQQGTLTASYPFRYSGLECVFNLYILPNNSQREERLPGHDNRMKRATKQQIVNLQGIYIKRNGRILDGPWNGMWRREGMGMSTSHHTVARWELVLPPDAVNFPELVPPDKSRVSLLGMLREIRLANRVKRRWHPEDASAYQGGNHDDLQFNQRARARQNGHDLITSCGQEDCNVRVNNQEYCDAHTTNRCQLCNDVLEQGTICETCESTICIQIDCNAIKIANSEFCITCSQPECVIEECNSLQQITGNYCESCARNVCNFPGGCESLAVNGFSRCAEHMRMDFSDVNIIISIEGPLFRFEQDNLTINVEHEDFTRYLQFIQNVR
jgi:hypothetical protein